MTTRGIIIIIILAVIVVVGIVAIKKDSPVKSPELTNESYEDPVPEDTIGTVPR